MKVQINSDSSINKDLSTKKYVAGEVNRVFKRYSAKLTRVEVHLTDVNRGKSGTHDKRCTVEVRPAEHRPLTVSNGARTIKESLGGALTKMRSAPEPSLGGRVRAAVPAPLRQRCLTPPPSRRPECIG